MRICPECQRPTLDVTCPHDGTPTVDETLLRDATDPLLGAVLAGRFRLLEPLGRGGMGRVYLADQIAMKRRVAVKVIRAETMSETGDRLDLVRRFQREALAASRLQHPNTVRIFDYGNSDDGLLFIAMELLVGPTLTKLLRREKRLLPERAVRVAVQVCKSLSEAHAQGIVHRDLKPDNIILTDVAGERDFVKVLDFGIAKVAMPGSDSALTISGVVIGTPTYMAPEQGRGQPVSPATDLYSLGVILYHCLTGREPFTGDTPLAVMMKHAQEPVPSLVVDGFPPDVPPALERVVLSMLAKRPEDRPGPALEVARLLEASLHDTTVRFGTPELPEQATVALPQILIPAREVQLPTEVAAERPRSHWKAWLVLLALLLGVGGAWLVASTWSDERPAAPAAAGPDVPDMEAVQAASAVIAVPDPGPAPALDVVMSVDGAPAARPADVAKPLQVRERRPAKAPKPPACESLRCPFNGTCIAPDGHRTTGDDYCFPSFR